MFERTGRWRARRLAALAGAVLALSVSVPAWAYSVSIQPDLFAGQWHVQYVTPWTYGPLTVDLGTGTHRIWIGAEGFVDLNVSSTGVVTTEATSSVDITGSPAEGHTVTFNTTPVVIQRGSFTGAIHIGGVTPWTWGDIALQLVPGMAYRLWPGAGGYFTFVVTPEGLIQNSVAPRATAAGNTLTLQTVPLTILRGAFQGALALADITPWIWGDISVQVVPGMTYRLWPGGGGYFHFQVTDAGLVSNGEVPATGVASGSTLSLLTVPITIDPGPSTVSHALELVTPATTGLATFDLVPGINYKLLVPGAFGFFSVGAPCAPTPPLTLGGTTFAISCGPLDADDDGILDDADNCSDVANADQANLDGDTLGDACDPDDDGDLALDGADNCAFQANPDQGDLDGDGLGDVCDADDDGDGHDDASDNCPLAPNDQSDLDGDGLGNPCDGDVDGDGVDDGSDTCATTPNADQLDQDHDGLGNACDADLDGDGVSNAADVCPDVPDAGQADADEDGAGDACDEDDDGDLVPDAQDLCPSVADADQADSDLDQLGDACDDDDDDDGVLDGADVCPLVADASQADLDGDGRGDACDADDDADGVPDDLDECPGSPVNLSVNALGCTGAQLVASQCEPAAFAKHGKYVACVTRSAHAAAQQGLITANDAARFVVRAARSDL